MDVLSLDAEKQHWQGKVAEWFLQSEELQAAWSRVEASISREWARAKTPEGRERAHVKLEVWKDLQRELRAMMERGQPREATLS